MPKGIAKALTLGIVIVVVAVVGMAAIFVAGGDATTGIVKIVSSVSGSSQSSSSSTSSSDSFSGLKGPAPSGFGQSVLQDHVNNINSRNVALAAQDYTPNGIMIWSGDTQGLGGTYQGTGNIRLTYQTAIGAASTLSHTIGSFNASGSTSDPNIAVATAVINFKGVSSILGQFNGTIDSKFDYVNQGGTWLIQQEDSSYQTFKTQYATGTTTFPQWQITGPPLPFRYSESPFKNFVYFDGGALAVLLIAAYLATLPLAIYVKKKRSSNRAAENSP